MNSTAGAGGGNKINSYDFGTMIKSQAMNPAYIHLATNHVPIVGAAFGIIILLVGFFKKNDEFNKAALWIFIFSGLSAVPAWLSGGRAARIVRNLPGVTKDFIGPHAEMADKFAIAIWVVGGLSLIALWLGRGGRQIPKVLMILIFFAALAAGGLSAYTANLGGQIHHEEIHKDFKLPEPAPAPSPS